MSFHVKYLKEARTPAFEAGALLSKYASKGQKGTHPGPRTALGEDLSKFIPPRWYVVDVFPFHFPASHQARLVSILLVSSRTHKTPGRKSNSPTQATQ